MPGLAGGSPPPVGRHSRRRTGTSGWWERGSVNETPGAYAPVMADHFNTPARLGTGIPGLEVREHAPADASVYYELVQANREHLTQHGDYRQLVAGSREETERRFAAPGSGSLRCGIWKDERLIGHVTLVHGEPPRWGVGFWLAEDATRRGYMTASLAALLEHARRALEATEVLGGVTHGNHRSSAVLIRLGFVPIAEFPTYTRYQLLLGALVGTPWPEPGGRAPSHPLPGAEAGPTLPP